MIDFTNCPKDDPWILWDNEGNSRILTTSAEFDYARLIIAKNVLEGYYLTRPNDDNKYYINHYGVVEDYPFGLFDCSIELSKSILEAAWQTKEKERNLNKINNNRP